jgi:hypothetical protein
MNSRALMLGVLVGLGGTLLLGLLFTVFPLDANERPMWAILLLSYAAGALVDVATGATAGWIARQRGALHGLLVGVIANLLSPVLGYGMMWLRIGREHPLDIVEYAFAILPGSVMGVLLAMLAGMVAATIARRQDIQSG